MNFKTTQDVLNDFIADFSEGKLTKAELESFSEVQDRFPKIRRMAQSGIRVHNRLKSLKKVKARDGFDQLMMARFSEELEREIQSGNSTKICKNEFLEQF